MSRVIQDFRKSLLTRSYARNGSVRLTWTHHTARIWWTGLGHVAYGVAPEKLNELTRVTGQQCRFSHHWSCTRFLVLEVMNKSQFLPKLATAGIVGCFGLTEPDYGSDPGGMVTKAVPIKGYRLSGAKTWISNAPYADIAIVWAKLDGIIRGFIVERKTAETVLQHQKSKASYRCGLRSLGQSRWTMPLFRKKTYFLMLAG